MSQARTTELLNVSLGSLGGKVINDTTATTPDYNRFTAIQSVEDTVINTVTGNVDIDGLTLLAGMLIYGRWSSITLTSGTVIAYEID